METRTDTVIESGYSEAHDCFYAYLPKYAYTYYALTEAWAIDGAQQYLEDLLCTNSP